MQERDTYADLADSTCRGPTRHPTEEGAPKRGAHAANKWSHAIAYEPTVQSSPRGPGSRTLRVHHLRKVARLIGSALHRMQILASFESPKFRDEGRPAREGASRKGARPCPQRARGEGCVTLNLPYDTNCIVQVCRGPGHSGPGLCVMWTNFALTAF
jgi:hypothetical protein